jgi:hypothetical protein
MLFAATVVTVADGAPDPDVCTFAGVPASCAADHHSTAIARRRAPAVLDAVTVVDTPVPAAVHIPDNASDAPSMNARCVHVNDGVDEIVNVPSVSSCATFATRILPDAGVNAPDVTDVPDTVTRVVTPSRVGMGSPHPRFWS